MQLFDYCLQHYELILIFAPCQCVGSMMGHLADKMVKNKKVFGSNIQEILKVRSRFITKTFRTFTIFTFSYKQML